MKKRANVLKVTFFYFNNHLPNKETNEKCLEKQRNQTKNRKTSPQQGNQRKLLRKTSPQQGNQRKALLDLAAARLVKIEVCNRVPLSEKFFWKCDSEISFWNDKI